MPSKSGTDEKKKALFRACFCVYGFYRLHRFGYCRKCPNKGFTCINETLNLAKGFYWTWDTKGHGEDYHGIKSTQRKEAYINFTRNIKTTDGSHDRKFNFFLEEWIPPAYACPVATSCKGYIDSECENGYEGPLCAVCTSGYHRLISRCKRCPTIPWIAGQLVTAVSVLIIFAIVIMRDQRRDQEERTITDIVLARAKIVITFYQVASITVESFSYISWPIALITIQQYVKLIHLNLLQIVPLHCISNAIRIDSQKRVIFFVCFNVITVLTVVLYYHLKKFYFRYQTAGSQYQIRLSLSKLKERCWRNGTLILFVAYPTTSLEILQILPIACHRICSDRNEAFCNKYLTADYSINCNSASYKRSVPFFYLAASYVVVYPVVLFAFLFKCTRKKAFSGIANSLHGNEIKTGLRFLYENYTDSCWFWEMIEIGRKLLFTMAIVFADTESRSYLAFLVVTSGLYTVLVASYKPIKDTFEYWLQISSLLASLANLFVGMLLKIPLDETHAAVVKESDSVAVTVLIFAANVAVIAIIIGEKQFLGLHLKL